MTQPECNCGERGQDVVVRTQGALFAADALEHHLNNQLARAVAYCTLLVEDPRLPDELKERMGRALAAVNEASETFQRLLSVIRNELRVDVTRP